MKLTAFERYVEEHGSESADNIVAIALERLAYDSDVYFSVNTIAFMSNSIGRPQISKEVSELFTPKVVSKILKENLALKVDSVKIDNGCSGSHFRHHYKLKSDFYQL